MSIEKFLEQIEENCRLDHINEDELLDSLSSLFKKPALMWYRMVSPTWKTYAEFKEDALEEYSKACKHKKTLFVEALLRTQGAEEPVRDYISALNTIFSRFDTPWSIREQVALTIDNMLPKLKKKLKKDQENFTTLQQLLVKAQEVESYEFDEQWKPPPALEQSMLPEAAYRPKAKANTHKATIASIAEKSTSMSASEMEKAFQNFFDKKMKSLADAGSQNKNFSNNKPKSENSSTQAEASSSDSQARSTSQQSSHNRGGGAGRGRGRGNRGSNSRVITPKSDKNKDKTPGPNADKVLCWGCSWPGYTKATCPECSASDNAKNAQGSE